MQCHFLSFGEKKLSYELPYFPADLYLEASYHYGLNIKVDPQLLLHWEKVKKKHHNKQLF